MIFCLFLALKHCWIAYVSCTNNFFKSNRLKMSAFLTEIRGSLPQLKGCICNNGEILWPSRIFFSQCYPDSTRQFLGVIDKLVVSRPFNLGYVQERWFLPGILSIPLPEAVLAKTWGMLKFRVFCRVFDHTPLQHENWKEKSGFISMQVWGVLPSLTTPRCRSNLQTKSLKRSQKAKKKSCSWQHL